MAECTAEERALLDAIESGKGVLEARIIVALQGRDPKLFEAAVQARIESNAAAERASAAMSAYLEGLDARRPEFDAVYESVENEFRRRQRAAFEAAHPEVRAVQVKAVQA